MKYEKIPWSQVKQIEVTYVHHQSFVSITLFDQPKSIVERREAFDWFKRANKAMGFGDVSINPTMCGTSAKVIMGHLETYWRAWEIENEKLK